MEKLIEKFITKHSKLRTENEYDLIRTDLHNLVGERLDDLLVVLKKLMFNKDANNGAGYAWGIFHYILNDKKFIHESAYKMLFEMLDESALHNARAYSMNTIRSCYSYLEDFESIYEDEKHNHIRSWLGNMILDKQVEKVNDNTSLPRYARNDEYDKFGYELYASNNGDAYKGLELINILQKSQCISDHMKLKLEHIKQRMGEPKYKHKRINVKKTKHSVEQNNLRKEILDAFNQYNKDPYNEDEQYKLEDLLFKLITKHGTDVLSILRDYIFDQEEKGYIHSVDCIFTAFSFDEYADKEKTMIGNIALEVFDKHPNDNIRNGAITSIYDFYNLQSELEKRYLIEKDFYIKYYIGTSILSMQAQKAGLKDVHNLIHSARSGDTKNFHIRLIDYSIEEQKQQLEFLKDNKLVSDSMRDYIKNYIECEKL